MTPTDPARTAPSAPEPADACPCGSGGTYGTCCGPIIAGDPAPTAEHLMRSRFTAFALRDADHLLRSWHASTRPTRDELVADLDPARRWTRLVIHAADHGSEPDVRGTVEFTALARGADGAKLRLRERSRFIRDDDGRWAYLDGDQLA